MITVGNSSYAHFAIICQLFLQAMVPEDKEGGKNVLFHMGKWDVKVTSGLILKKIIICRFIPRPSFSSLNGGYHLGLERFHS